MAEFKCPLCKQNVSEELYQKITGIWKERRIAEKQFKEKQRLLIKQEKENKQRWKEEKYKFKAEQEQIFAKKLNKLEEEKIKIKERFDKQILTAVKTAEVKARREKYQELKLKMEEAAKRQIAIASSKKDTELKRVRLTLQSTQKQMSTLQIASQKQQQKIADLEKQLKDKTTPQLEGLLYEDQLLEALKREFTEDKFEHTGKGGDIIQAIILDNQPVGIIVFECKRVGQWQTAHAEQAARAKIQRKADYAILVTNASKKGGCGFFVERDVIVVHPGGVLALARILREQLYAIARMKLTSAQREEAIEKVFEYLQGSEFKNSIDIVIRKTIEMYEDLKKECQEHVRGWKKRYETLKMMHSNSALVKIKTAALISGKTIQVGEVAIQEFPTLPNLTEI